MIRRNGKVSGLGRRHCKFTPQTIDVLLVIVHSGKFHHVVASGRMGSIGTNEEVESNFNLLCSIRSTVAGLIHDLKPSLLLPEVGAGQLVLEEELDVR